MSPNLRLRLTFLFSVLFLASGCQNSDAPTDSHSNGGEQNKSVFKVDGQSHDHVHADKLVWVKKDISIDGYLVTLGHHGDHFHFGDRIEPAAMITRNGDDVPDAKVQNGLLAASDSSVVSEIVDTTFEPKTEQEPAHYAQGELVIPKDKGKIQIQFTIGLPGIDEVHQLVFDLDCH